MERKMFCFQCEQTAACTGCTGKAGVCGKTADVAQLQDELTGALIGLARATDGGMQATPEAWRLMIEGLFTTVTNVNFNEKTIRELTGRVHAEKAQLVPDCSSCAAPCGRTSDYDMNLLWSADEDIRSLKSLVLFGVRGMAAYAHHAMVLGYTDDEVNRFFAKALFAIGEDWGMEELLPIVMEVGEKNLKCMALLDKANTESYGTPAPAYAGKEPTRPEDSKYTYIFGGKWQQVASDKADEVVFEPVFDTIAKSYTVDFYVADDISDVAQKTYTYTKNYNQTLAFPQMSREGYAFVGWYTDKYYTQKFAGDVMSEYNLTLYGYWRVALREQGPVIALSYAGKDESGNLLIVHCAFSANNVVITGVDGFTSIGRPVFYNE